MRLFLIFLLFSPLFLFSQIQIGIDIGAEAAEDFSGYVSISNDGTIVAIGGPGNDDVGLNTGHVRVFENVSGNWVQIGSDINGEAAGDNFGRTLSITGDGSVIAVGAYYNDIARTDPCYVNVYQNISGTWTKIGDTIFGDAVGDWFGFSVSISNNGAILSTNSKNYTRIYENISGIWTQIGSDINVYEDYLITNSTLSGDGTVVVTNHITYDFWWNIYSYHVVYKNISGIWTPIGDGIFSNADSVSLSYDGSIIAIGNSVIRVYEDSADQWIQLGEDIETESYSRNISLSGNANVLAIGGIGGIVTRIYENNSGSWTQLGVDINRQPSEIAYGQSLELSHDGSVLAIGSPQDSRNGTNAGHVRIFDLAALLSVEESKMLNVRLFPNPATNQFTIRLPDSQTLEKVNIYNNLGQFIQICETHIIKTSHLTSGLYYVEVITNSGKETKKLLINK